MGHSPEALVDLGGQEALALDKHTVDPHQFLGLEINPRAAAIAELVIWLGYLQWHFRTRGAAPSEPILRDFRNIKVMDAVLTWDGYPVPKVETHDGKRIETYPRAHKPDWPEAEFIVGNPPFIGGKDIRAALGDGYTETLWRVHNDINDSADFVMYWWDRAAEIVARGTTTLRFGFVTTNSITQTFSRRVVARHLEAKKPISLLMAIPDHPWTKATDKAAAVRIAMTVVAAGRQDGVLREVTREEKLDTDQPEIEFKTKAGRINADLTVGVDLQTIEGLRANEGLSSRGMSLHGSGFIVTPQEAEALGLGKRPGLEKHIRPYRNGRDLTSTPRGVMVIDLFGLEADDVRKRFPEVFQHIVAEVRDKIEIDEKTGEKKYVGRAWNKEEYRRTNWWLFGRTNTLVRGFTEGLSRYIVTVETAKHRVFQFLDASIVPDNKLVGVGSDDAFYMGVLSSHIHVVWALRAGGWLGVGNDSVYVKSRCFDPFPFPECAEGLKDRIRALAEELDAHRKTRQVEHPRLTLTQMYNVLEKLKAEVVLDELDEQIKQEGLVLNLRDIHKVLDALVFEAYGWAPTLSDEEILERVVALNKQRSLEEKFGNVEWLRPDYQIRRFGSEEQKAAHTYEAKPEPAKETGLRPRQGALDLIDDLREMLPTTQEPSKARFPTGNELAETADVMRELATATKPLSIEQLARQFSQGKQIEKRVELTIHALYRLGYVASTDGGKTFTLRRAA